MIVSLPVPGIAVASMNSTSPPTGVQARPVATPGRLVRRRASEKRLRRPSSSRTRFAETDERPEGPPSAITRASLRQTVPICRSRLRTPASRVYSSMIARSAASENDACVAFRPFSRTCLGTRYRRAMWSFSSTV